MALMTDGKDDFADKEYADFTSEMWAEGHSFFCYLSDSPDSLSSCCRLRNSLKDLDVSDEDHNHTTHQYSMGTARLSRLQAVVRKGCQISKGPILFAMVSK